jgi:hypothetical protein
VYRALGGGWQIRLKEDPNHRPVPNPEDLPGPGPDDFRMPAVGPPLVAPPETLPPPRPVGMQPAALGAVVPAAATDEP